MHAPSKQDQPSDNSGTRPVCVAANLLYGWRRLMSEGGAVAVGANEAAVGTSEVRRLEERAGQALGPT